MTGHVTALVAGVGALLLLGLLVSIWAGRRKRSAAARRNAQREAASVRGAVSVPARQPAQQFAVAEPGLRGPLFQYGGDGPGFEVDAPYAVVDIATTGFSPANGDRIVEIAIARVDAHGRIGDEYSTLLNPGRDLGPVFLHGISNFDVRDAPTFADIAGELLDRLDGAIVVAHDAAFVERFLDAEFDRMGEVLPLSPAVCSLWLAQRTMRTPDHRLPTLARYAGLAALDAQIALGGVRTLAGLLPRMLAAHREPLRFLCGLRPMPEFDCDAAPKARHVGAPEPGDSWMTALLARRELPAAAAGEIEAQRYLDAVTVALADGRLLGGEAQTLARLAASAGLGAAQVERLHGRLLEHLRSAALADAILTTGQIRKLRTAAAALGEPNWFDELRPTSPQDLVAGRSVPVPREVRLCSHCRRPGHQRAGCPELASLAV
jgi:DNA polymerase III epsilon subunit-like protein